MNLKLYLFLALMLTAPIIQCADLFKKIYSASLWTHYNKVRETLKETGFHEIYFKTPDDLRLNGLFIQKADARCNIIICAGWLPGKMEGMANFSELLPDDCNVLFFDSRGHAKSEGPLLRNIWRYGVNEYKDIIGAISFTKTMNALPIIVCGVCSGAFNASHALISLEKSNLTEEFNIKGLIFDSGWGSVTKMSYTNTVGNIQKALILSLGSIYKTKNSFKQSFIYRLLSACAEYSYKIPYFGFVRPLIAQYETTTNLFDKIHHIKSPILFVHSHNDYMAHIEDAISLSSLASNKHCWWIEYSSHAAHHIKHEKLYKEKLAAFIDTCLQ